MLQRTDFNENSFLNRPEVNGGYVIARRHKPSPLPPQPSGPATPAPTPWLQLGKGPMSAGLYRDLTQSSLARAPSSIPAMAQLEDGTMRTRVTRPMDKGTLMNASVGVAWQASKSQVVGTPSTAVEVNTPKILELDVNRMMIGQTDVRCVHLGVNRMMFGQTDVRCVHLGVNRMMIGQTDVRCVHLGVNRMMIGQTDFRCVHLGVNRMMIGQTDVRCSFRC